MSPIFTLLLDTPGPQAVVVAAVVAGLAAELEAADELEPAAELELEDELELLLLLLQAVARSAPAAARANSLSALRASMVFPPVGCEPEGCTIGIRPGTAMGAADPAPVPSRRCESRRYVPTA